LGPIAIMMIDTQATEPNQISVLAVAAKKEAHDQPDKLFDRDARALAKQLNMAGARFGTLVVRTLPRRCAQLTAAAVAVAEG
jgi:hypothetical protein